MMKVMTLVVLMLVASTSSVDGQENCQVNFWTRQVVSHDSPCVCGADGTVCLPNELCYSYPENLNDPSPDPSTFRCFKQPCDDVSGDNWMYFGREPAPYYPGNFTTWGSASIEQENCAIEMTLTSLFNSTEQKTLYGFMAWTEEVYTISFFETLAELQEWDVGVGPNDDSSAFLSRGPGNAYFFAKDSAVHCTFSGSLVVQGPTSKEGVFLGSLSRVSLDQEYATSDEIEEQEGLQLIDSCMDGYPRAWTNEPATLAPTTSGSPSKALFTTSGLTIVLLNLLFGTSWR